MCLWCLENFLHSALALLYIWDDNFLPSICCQSYFTYRKNWQFTKFVFVFTDCYVEDERSNHRGTFCWRYPTVNWPILTEMKAAMISSPLTILSRLDAFILEAGWLTLRIVSIWLRQKKQQTIPLRDNGLLTRFKLMSNMNELIARNWNWNDGCYYKGNGNENYFYLLRENENMGTNLNFIPSPISNPVSCSLFCYHFPFSHNR